jgi:hypothetical protein
MEQLLGAAEGVKILDQAAYKVIGEETFPGGASNPFYVSHSVLPRVRDDYAVSIRRCFTHRKEQRKKDEESLRRLDERCNGISAWQYPTDMASEAQECIFQHDMARKQNGASFAEILADWPERLVKRMHELFIEYLLENYERPIELCEICYPPSSCSLSTMKLLQPGQGCLICHTSHRWI